MPDGELIPAYSWYPSYLPKFYRQSNGSILLRPLNSVPKYTEQDVLDVLLYYQTFIGYNRTDFQNAKPAAWSNTNGRDSAYNWVVGAISTDHDSGDFAAIPTNGYAVDGTLYSKLQNRFIDALQVPMPWLSSMQSKGGGIDLMSIPMATDIEQPRPSWYPSHLPSLFKNGGVSFQRPAGEMDTKPKIKRTDGKKVYEVSATDVAALCVYAQPIIDAGATPYPTNWYINDQVNGAMAMRFKVSIDFTSGFTNAQEQAWGMVGNIMVAPVLDENPYASGFTKTLQTIVSAAINFFAGKIPGGSKAVAAAYLAGSIGGGAYITGADTPPAGPFSAAVFAAAQQIKTNISKSDTTQKLILIGGLLGLVGWWAHDEGYI